MSIAVSPMDKDRTVTSFWKACFKNPMKMSNILEIRKHGSMQYLTVSSSILLREKN